MEHFVQEPVMLFNCFIQMSDDVGKCIEYILSNVKKELHIVVNNVRLDLHNVFNDTGYLTVLVFKYSEIYQRLTTVY